MSVLSIDFGAAFTKAAIWDRQRQAGMPLTIGKREGLFLPSLFHVSSDRYIRFGEEAEMAMQVDPQNAIENLKLRLDQPWHFLPNRQKVSTQELLKLAFTNILGRVPNSISCTQERGELPETMVVTVPATSPGFESIYREALTETGFPGDIHCISEPEAVGLRWLHQYNPNDNQILLVIDVGGGTVDWACLRFDPSIGVSLAPECSPDGAALLGTDIDRALLAFMLDRIPDQSREKVLQNRTFYLKKICEMKESLDRKIGQQTKKEELAFQIPIGNTEFCFRKEIFASIFENAISPNFFGNLSNYFAKLCSQFKSHEIHITIVGGASRLLNLKQRIQKLLEKEARKESAPIQFIDLGHGTLATVLGAASFHASSHKRRREPLNGLSADSIRNTRGKELGSTLIQEAIFCYFEQKIERLGQSDLLKDFFDLGPSNMNSCLSACGKAMKDYFDMQRFPPTIRVCEPLIKSGVPDIKIPRNEMDQLLNRLVSKLKQIPWDETSRPSDTPQD